MTKAPAGGRAWVLGGAVATVVAIGAAAVFLAPWGWARTDLHPISGQNVLLITIDTLRADALSGAGGPAQTPALDRLAGEGVRFDFAHAHAVLTLPSHASILTGQFPFQHRVRDNSGFRLAPGARTIATVLKQSGYATGAFVGAFPLHSRFGLNQGFDVYDDRFGETRAPSDFDMPERPASAVVSLARQWIAAQATPAHPWFAWVHVFDPHAPYRPPAPFDAQYAGRLYYGEVAATDAALGPLLDDVRASERPTLVVVTGDHGESLGEHGEASHGLFAYEATLRIPLIIAQAGGRARRAGGEVSSIAARHVDILPTILDAVGRPAPADLPGTSLLSPAQRRGTSPRPSYFESMGPLLNRGWAPLTGVLAGREKYIDLPIAERYDLSADPGERANLAGRTPERDRTMAASVHAFGAALPGERVRETPDAADRLRALGYVSGAAPSKPRYTEADDPKRLVDIDQAIHRAVEAFGARRLDDAVQLYEQVIARRPDMGLAYRHLAFIEWQRGNTNGAIAALRRAVQAGASQPLVLSQLGGYLADAGRASEALRVLEPIARDPGASADTINSLGIAYARAGRGEDAARAFERLMTLTPASSVPLENLGLLALERGDEAAAQARFERATEVDARSSRAWAGLGTVRLKRGDRTSAVEAWTRAVQLDPANVDALFNLGVALARDNQATAARRYLEQFLEKAPPSRYADERKEVSRLLQGLK